MRQIRLITYLTSFLFFSCSCHASCNTNLEDNKEIVTTFYNVAFNQKDPEEAAKYFGKTYKQHNPRVTDGIEGFKNYIRTLKNNSPNMHAEIKQIHAEGNYVFIYVHFTTKQDTKGFAVMDIFKLDNGKIIEHWGVTQEIPKVSANSNGMF